MSEREQELLSALENLEASAEKPCGCHEKKAATGEDPFASNPKSAGQLISELDSALKAVSTEQKAAAEFSFAMSSGADEAFLEFGEVDMGLPVSLEDIVSAAERHPGLKITFSF
jgi:hypothetical protein